MEFIFCALGNNRTVLSFPASDGPFHRVTPESPKTWDDHYGSVSNLPSLTRLFGFLSTFLQSALNLNVNIQPCPLCFKIESDRNTSRLYLLVTDATSRSPSEVILEEIYTQIYTCYREEELQANVKKGGQKMPFCNFRNVNPIANSASTQENPTASLLLCQM